MVEAIAVVSPKPNTYAEHFVRSIKESCLERLILFGERSLRIAVREFVRHCHMERHHRGLIQPDADHLGNTGPVHRRQRLGGSLNYSPPRSLTWSRSLS